MSDRIAVMSNGRVEQVASPRQIYDEPSTVFVADFLGVSNLMQVTARGADSQGRCRIRLDNFELQAARGDTAMSGETKATIRPERVRLEPQVPPARPRARHGRALGVSRQRRSADRAPRHRPSHQVLIQNTGDDIPYAPGHAVQVHLPADALRVLTDTGAPGARDNGGAAAPGR
jgi:ABC-type Fe3+/spermidine/putrescine transport system ATPase subunit